jgi:G:T-mismatch repair DNA endonuclease (very short patch repair protein)
MAKRRGKLLSELSLIQRAPVGKSRLERVKYITPTSPITLHRRGLMQVDYRAPDPREQYAVSDSEVHGTLPERIIYKSLTDRHLVPGSDFTFQSSLVGGRIHLGGIVCDFLFERPPLVIRVQGMYWHGEFDRDNGDLMHGEITQSRRDDEQGQTLNRMGYAVVDVWEEDTYNPFILQAWMNKWVDPLLVGVG